MRKAKWLPALVIGLCLAGQARAQQLTFFNFGSAQPIQNVPLNTTQVAQNIPIAQPQSIANRVGFRLRDYIPAFRGINNHRVIGQSTFPTAANMPGQNYLQAFKYGRGVPIVP